MISSTEFLTILEDAIRTFMNFLKADKQSYRQMLKSLVKKKSSSVDPTLLHLLKKANKKVGCTALDKVYHPFSALLHFIGSLMLFLT